MQRRTVLLIICSLFLIVKGDVFEINRRLGKGMNLGNTLEAPREGAWGERFDTTYIEEIAKKGFNSVRIPVKWSPKERTEIDSPYTITEQFFEKVDAAVTCALNNKLLVMINIHHYDSLFANPDKEWNRFKAMWKQIAERYKDYPDSLVFEILNEPNTNLTAAKWNTLLAETFSIIRETNPTRAVVLGTAEWGGVDALSKLILPQDSNIILTVHYYKPFSFTHQGASWVDGSESWVGTKWNGTYHEKKAGIDDFEYVRKYSLANKIPVYVGEFGAIELADMASRGRWTSFCARLFEKYEFSWAYWALGAGFAAYDRSAGKWIDTIADALLSTDTTILAMDSGAVGIDIIKNGNFADTTYWSLGVWDTAAEATSSVSNGVYTVVLTNPGTKNYSVQLLQYGVKLQKSHSYVLSFDIAADAERFISVAIDQYIDPVYTEYGSKWNFPVGTEKKTVTVPFNMAIDDSAARVNFFFGIDKPTTHISNVKLYDMGPANGIVKPAQGAKIRVVQYRVSIKDKSLRIKFQNSIPEPVSIVLMNLNGQVVYRNKRAIPGSFNELTVPLNSFSQRMMVLQLQGHFGSESMLITAF